ncbi:MAG: hypothetical protein LUD01_07170 [Clostridiales bacterium]|nr:hypothetical protein [Clostridiales bacterium]
MKKRTVRRFLVGMLTGTVLLSMLAGCGESSSGDSSSTDTADAAESSGDQELNLLVWEGYADASFADAFEEEYDCKVNATYFTTSDDLIAKLKAGGGDTYDIISPSGDMAGYIVQNGTAEAIDVSRGFDS